MKKNFCLLLLGLLTLGLASCSDNDYFSLDDYQTLIKKSFPVDNVDPNQTWATLGTATATVTVNGDYGETYTVGITLENPRTGGELTQLYKGTVESGSTLITKVSYPLTAEVVYVGIYDKAGRRIVMTAPVKNNRIDVTYDNGALSAAPRRATEAEETQYAKTFEDYLNPTYVKVNSWDVIPTVQQVTLAQMKAYPAFTEADLNGNKDLNLGGTVYQTSTLFLNGSLVSNPDGYFTIEGNQNYNSKFTTNGQEYWSTAFTKGLKMEKSTTIKFTTKGTGTVKIAQSNWKAENASATNTIKLDGTEQTVTGDWGAVLYYEKSITAGEHTITRGSGESGLFYVEVYDVYTDSPFGDGLHLRVAPGTTIEGVNLNDPYTDSNGQVVNHMVVYVEGTLHLSSARTLNNPTIVVADGGELVIDNTANFSGNGRILVMDGGKVTGASGATINVNNGGYCYNAGEIDFEGTMNLNGSHFYNSGTVNVSYLTGTAGGTHFVNFGRITAVGNNNAGSTYNQSWVNGCYIHFTGNAGVGNTVMLTDSRFDIDGNTEPIAGTLEMHNQSEFKVGGYMKMNGVTINGPTNAGEYAIVKCGKVYATFGDALNVNNRVYFDFNPNEIYGKDGSEGNNYRNLMNDNDYSYSAAYALLNKINYWVDENTALSEIAIPEGCAGTGFNSDGNEGDNIPEGDPIGFRFCFEDNFPEPGDYDFNDLVVTVVPTLNDKTLNIKVTLDAVGANEQLAAALRLVGLTSADVASTRVIKGFTAVPDNYSANLININTTETFLAPNVEPNKSGDYTIVLFKDAHYAINPIGTYPAPYIFYNTMSDVNNLKGTRVTKKTAEFEIVFNNADKASDFLAENLYDLFLVENYNGAYWEVHTYEHKLSQVFHTKPSGYTTNYADIYVWALKLPNSFQYPVEWQGIGAKSGATSTGAYLNFGSWVQNHSTNTDWWKTPASSSLVYNESQLEGSNIPATVSR